MIFFAIFIVNSFLNSGLGYVGTSGGVGLSGNISGAISFNLNSSLWSSLRSFLLWSIALIGFCERNWSWIWEWLRVNEISSVSFLRGVGHSTVNLIISRADLRLNTHLSMRGGVGFGDSDSVTE